MIQSFKLWWQERSLRERQLLGVMFALLAVVILWFGIVGPIESGKKAARADHAEALDRNAAIRARLAVLKRPMPAMAATSGPLASRVETSAGEAGFILTRNAAASSGRVDIAIGSARPTALFGWIGGLEAQGVAVEMLTVTPAASGTVAAQMTLAERVR
jgi:general secretion pathway protein M